MVYDTSTLLHPLRLSCAQSTDIQWPDVYSWSQMSSESQMCWGTH